MAGRKKSSKKSRQKVIDRALKTDRLTSFNTTPKEMKKLIKAVGARKWKKIMEESKKLAFASMERRDN